MADSNAFGDFLKSAGEAFGNVYGALNPPKAPKAVDPNTAARAAATDQSTINRYLLIGGAALLAVVLLVTLSRR